VRQAESLREVGPHLVAVEHLDVPAEALQLEAEPLGER
jgi:hypothetical protein